MSSASLVFDLIAKDRASGTFDKVGNASHSAGSKLRTFAKAGALAAGAMAVAAGAIAGKFLVDSVKGWQDHLKVVAQSEAVIKSTGGAAGVTAKQVGDLADAIERKTGVDGDSIMTGQNLLLTFTNLKNEAGKGNDIFNQTTKLMTDLSVSMGQSTKTSAIQLGKALNDPIKGVSALSKVGVTFTDQQKEQIKTMQEAGNTAGAQKVILAELTKEFGGSAEAQATTGSRLVAVYHQVQDAVGAKLLPVMEDLGNWFLDKGLPAIKKFGGWLSDTFGPIIGDIVHWVSDKLVPALMSAYQKALPGLKSAFESVKKGIQSMKPMFDLLGHVFVDVLLPTLGQLARTTLPLLGKAFEIVGKAIGVLGKVGTWLWNSVFQPVFKLLAQGVSALLDLFGDLLGALGHVPGFGWAKDAAASLHDAADATKRLSDNIKKIPNKTVHINVVQTVTTKGDFTGNSLGGHTPYLQTGQGPI